MLAQAQPYQRVAWFVFECIEREHRLNLDALSAYWLGAPLAWLGALSLPGSGPAGIAAGARGAAAGARIASTRPGASPHAH
jgi:hypothetical protein